MSYQSEVMADAPRCYYRLGEASGTTMADSSGNGRAGTYAGTIGFGQTPLVPFDSNNAISLNGNKANNGSVVDATWMHPTLITLETWIKPAALNGTILGRANFGASNGPQYAWHLGTTSTGQLQVTFFVGGTATKTQVISPAGSIVVGSTYHVAATFDGTTITLYINGAVAATGSLSGTLSPASGQNLYIGRETFGSSPYNGVLDEVAIYDHALSASRIAAHYAATGTALPTFTGSWGIEF